MNTVLKNSIVARISIAIAVCMTSAFVAHAANAAATLKMSPSSGTFEVGATIDVSLLLDTGGDSINVVSADITFPQDKLQIINPAASASFITIWAVSPTYSNVNGTLSLQGGLPNPGIKTSSGVVTTITFRVKSAGKASLKYSVSSKVLKNDGEGTNILGSSNGAELLLKNPPPAGPVVTSPTHPESTSWYNNQEPQFVWEPVTDAVGYSYAFNQIAKFTPEDQITTSGTTASGKATADGVWYFHVRAKGETWGAVTSYPVQIDTTAPAEFHPKLNRDVLTVDESGTLTFLTTDGASGIDHYEVKQIDSKNSSSGLNTIFVESASPYTIPKLPASDYEFVVRAIDRAGNITDASTTLQVVASGLPFYARTPLFRNVGVANLIIIVLMLLALITIILLLIRRFRLRASFRHDLEALERDAQKKYASLQGELQDLNRARRLVDTDIGQTSPSSPPNTIQK